MPGWEGGTYLDGNKEPSEIKTAYIKIFLYFYHEQWSSQEGDGALPLSTPLFSQTLNDSLSPGSPHTPPRLSRCLYCSLTWAFEVLLYYLPISLTLHPWEKLTSLLYYHKEEKMLGVGRKKTNLPPYPLHAGHCARGLHLVYCHFSNHLANRNYPHMWYETLRWCHVSRVIEPNLPVGFKIKTWFHLTLELMFL